MGKLTKLLAFGVGAAVGAWVAYERREDVGKLLQSKLTIYINEQR